MSTAYKNHMRLIRAQLDEVEKTAYEVQAALKAGETQRLRRGVQNLMEDLAALREATGETT